MLIMVSRVAQILGIGEGTVRALERRGELPAQRTSSGVRLFDQATIERIARDRAKKSKRRGEAS